MQTHKRTLLYIAILSLFIFEVNAQDGYTYTLIDNGSYSYTIGAVPNASTNNFATSVQSYGFTIILPDGVTASISSSLGSAANATFFDGNAVGQSAIDGYLITETLGSPVSLAAPSSEAIANIITIQINGAPTSGTLYILENNSALATTVTALKSFMQADMIDNGMAAFVNVVDPNAAAVSGMSSFDFSTLSIAETNELTDISVYPNPTKGIANITNSAQKITTIDIVDLQGKFIKRIDGNFSKIDLTDLNDGMYLLKIHGHNSQTKTIKLVKN